MENKTIFFKMMEKMLEKGKLTVEELEKMSKMISKELGVSEKFKWCVDWKISKFDSEELENLGTKAIPYEVKTAKANITLNNGIEMMWKIVGGITEGGVTPFSNTAARIFVGSSTTAENATQTGVITSLGNTGMDAGFPQVQGRSIIFQGTFKSEEALGNWREVSIANGSGANSVSLNRKVEDMGTKASGTSWIMKLTISAITG